ncbi:MAG TPA: hypothetical protein VEX62_04065 [Candidatus Limnocylindrales bacterium]|nr:hypothetical protein [Candidatus Limnocylindrales bacterium]
MSRRWPYFAYVFAVALLGMVALGAALELSAQLNVLWTRFPGPAGLRNLIVLLVLGALGLAGLVGVARLPRRWALLIAVGALLATRLAALIWVEPALVRDMQAYDSLARGVLAGECCFGDRPMGYPMLLAIPYALGLPGELVGFVFAIAAAPLLWLLGRAVADERSGAVAVYIYAVAPSLALFSGVLMTETVYATALLAALVPFVGGVREGSAALSGLLLGASQYIRATSVYLAPVFLVAMIRRRAWKAAGAFSALLIVALLPVIVATGGVSTSTIGGLSLMMGTNQASDGWYNEPDVALYATWGDDRERLAVDEAVRRVASDPRGFAELAVRKSHAMWTQEHYGVTFAMTDAGASQADQAAAFLASQFVYTLILIAAVVTGWRLRHGRPLLAWLILGIFVSVGAIHIFAEVQPRYHAYVVPLFIVLAAPAIARLARRREPASI